MAETWLETFLGLTGKYLLEFLDSYYFYLIPVILVYGFFMTLSSFNLKRIEKRLIYQLVKQTKAIIEENPSIGFISLTERLQISLERLINRYSFFPFVSDESGLWVLKTNLPNVRALILADNRRMLLMLNRKGILLPKENQKIKDNLYLEVIQKISGQG